MRLRRLGQMDLAEIADRSRQKATQWVDRVAPALGVRRPQGGLAVWADADLEAAAMVELFRDASPSRFFAGAENGDAVEILRDQMPAACRDIVSAANAVCSRRFDLLGYEGLSFGEKPDWHLDAVSGRRAPLVHWSRIDLGDAGIGDPKVTWELNRHQWLVPLAQAYALSGDRRYALEATDLVDEWSRANPYGIGINWASSLEVSFRLIAWSWAFILTRDAATLSTREFSGLLGLIRAHATHIEQYLSRYSSPNTHLTGEALGLFYAGVLFPELPEAARWRRAGYQILVQESRRQILDDGVYFEQATVYQRYTVDIYLHFLILAERNGLPVPHDVRARVERMLEFLLAVSGPDGTMPQIGDADGGWLLPLTRRAAGDSRGTFGVAAALFGRGDFLWAAGGSTPEVLWLLGKPGWDQLRGLTAHVPVAPASEVFRKGGYVIMRGGWKRDAHQMILDVGPLGSKASAAHGHADLLSVQCTAFGEPYIVDPGTFCYAVDMKWRNHFRGTGAHSTVTVDGAPQAEPSGPFSWKSAPAAMLDGWTTSKAFDLVDASHDAYDRLADPVKHRRRVLFVRPRFWLIVDDLGGRAEHDVAVGFQFSPRQVDVGPGPWVAARGRRGSGLWLAAFSSAPVVASVRAGETEPPAGWVSAHYGRREPAPFVTFSTRARLPLRVVTLVLPAEQMGAAPSDVQPVHDDAGALTGLRVGGDLVRFADRTLAVEAQPEAGTT